MKTALSVLRFLLFASLFSMNAAFAQAITVYSSGSVEIGTTRQLSAYVPLVNPAVTWSVNDIPGGDAATVGTVSSTGLYAAPKSVPAANVVTVKATNIADPSKWGSVAMTITQPQVYLWSAYPSSLPVGGYTLSLNGRSFGANSTVYVNGALVPATLVNATSLKFSGNTTAAQIGQTLAIKVINTGAGGTSSDTVNVSITAAPPVAVTTSPSAPTVLTGATQQFSATVANTTNTAVNWAVNGIAGGNSTLGTVSASGLYTAPAAVPSPAAVTVSATSQASPSASSSATVTVKAAPPVVTVSVSPSSVTVKPSGTQAFSATVGGSANTAVSWTVNGYAGGNSGVGTISAAGVYTAPGVAPNPATVTIRATSVANPSVGASVQLSVVGLPDPGVSKGTANLNAGRFLEQSTFGPTPYEINRVNTIGISAWLDEQFAMPETPISNPSGNNYGPVQQEAMYRMMTAPDQLRQRVAFVLSQIIVISMNKNIYPDEMVPYLRLMSKHAFGNYRQLLGEISVSSQMGKFLDLANSVKPGVAGGANENYARELMQLFSIGLTQLNPDGSEKLDANGNTIPTYNQKTIGQVALALTGWTYPGPNPINWENFTGPMLPRDQNHDMTAKSFLGCNLPAGQTAQQDMDATLDCVFNHPNTAPFISLRLIRNLVTSNPSPAYVTRISNVFQNNGAGVRGDLKAVVRAILTDAEARDNKATGNFGRLKDSLFATFSFVRALGGTISPTAGVGYMYGQLGEAPLFPPTVFSFYAALYKVPGSSLAGPEFQIYSPTEAVLRNNFFHLLLTNPGGDFTVDISPFVAAAGNVQNLIDKIDQTLLYGRMPQAMRQSLANCIVAQSDNNSRAQAALMLTLASAQFAVHH